MIFFYAVLLFFTEVCPLQWSVLPANHAVISACVGRDVTIPWNITLDDGEHILDIQYYFQAPGQPNVSYALYAGNRLYTEYPGVEFVPNAGLLLRKVRPDDAGYYLIVVNSHDGTGRVSLEERRVNLVVATAPFAHSGQLDVSRRGDVTKDPVTGQWSEELQCGVLTSLGQPPVSVVWTTPGGQEVNSSRHDNGTFLISLPPSEVRSGNYTCHLPPSSPATLCLAPHSPLLSPASLYLDGKDVRLSVLEANQRELMSQMLHLMEVNTNQSSLIQQLQHDNDYQHSVVQQLQLDNNNQSSLIQQLEAQNAVLSQQVKENQRWHFTSCADWLNDGENSTSGVRTIFVEFGVPLSVFCDQDTDDGGWTVFQRRVDGSIDFDRNWTDYENGFGDVSGEFWLGLRALHAMTSARRYELRVDLTMFNGTQGYATFSNFSITDARDYYRLLFNQSTGGNAGDSLTAMSKNQRFTTKDADHDISNNVDCASYYHGAFWHSNCMNANPNGLYRDSRLGDNNGIFWFSFDDVYALKACEMKIRPT